MFEPTEIHSTLWLRLSIENSIHATLHTVKWAIAADSLRDHLLPILRSKFQSISRTQTAAHGSVMLSVVFGLIGVFTLLLRPEGQVTSMESIREESPSPK